MSALRSLWFKTSIPGRDFWTLSAEPGNPREHPRVCIIDNQGSCTWSLWDRRECLFVEAGPPWVRNKSPLRIDEAFERAEAKLLDYLSAHERVALIAAAAKVSDGSDANGSIVPEQQNGPGY